MDIQMPEMYGFEATRIINCEWKEEDRPRIIAMTANANEQEWERRDGVYCSPKAIGRRKKENGGKNCRANCLSGWSKTWRFFEECWSVWRLN